MIEQSCSNNGLYGYAPVPPISTFLNANMEFMSQQINASIQLPHGNPTRVYWYQVSLVLEQLKGLYVGYQYARGGKGNVTEAMFYAIQLAGELGDIANAVNASDDVSNDFFFNDHCSALVRVNDDLSDLYIGHVSAYYKCA